MATFYQMTPDAYNSGFQGLTKSSKNSIADASVNTRGLDFRFANVRRPVRGIQIKDDTYAIIQVRSADGVSKPLIDAGGPLPSGNFSTTYKYSNFLIQSIQQQRVEKKQIVETFGEPYIFFFGQHPVMLQVSGVLLNTEDYNWRAEFMQNYDTQLRGTACVQNKTRVYLSWDTIVTEGYILECSTQEVAAERQWLNFSFQMFLTNYADVSPIGLSNFPHPAEFQLDPTSTDTTGLGIGTIQNPAQTSILNSLPLGSSSLIDAVASLVTDASGQVSGVTQATLSLFSGRQIVVPAGLAASSSAAQTVQSLIPASNGRVALPPSNNRFAAAIYGPIQKNLDEYIARVTTWGASTRPLVANLYPQQTASSTDVGGLIQDAVSSFGIQAPAPTSLINAGKAGSFATISSFTPGSTITKTTGGLPSLPSL